MRDKDWDIWYTTFSEAIEYSRQSVEKCFSEPCLEPAEVGQHVLLCAAAIGYGFDWERIEAKVLVVADSAYKVEFVSKRDIYNKIIVKWVHKFFVTDVLENESS